MIAAKRLGARWQWVDQSRYHLNHRCILRILSGYQQVEPFNILMLPKERLSGRKCQSCGELLSGLCARSRGFHWYASSQKHNVEKSWTHFLLLKEHPLAPKDSKMFQRFHAVLQAHWVLPTPANRLRSRSGCWAPFSLWDQTWSELCQGKAGFKFFLALDSSFENWEMLGLRPCSYNPPWNLWKTWIRTCPLFCHDVCGNPHYWYYIQLFHGPMGPAHMLKSPT